MLRALFELTYSLISVAFSNLQWFSSLLPAATKLWPRLCFYTCVWFCSQGGLQAGRTPPIRENPPGTGRPPRPGRTPRPGRPPGPGRTPPDQGEPPRTRQTLPPDQADPPGTGRPPLPPRPGRPPWTRQTPPRKQTPEYGLRAAGIHPTGMHSCFPIYLVSTYIVCERLSVMHEPAGVVEILVQILTEYPPFWSSEYPPPKWKLSDSISESFRILPKWKLSQSPNLRVSEYPPKMKIVTESKSESFRIPPCHENCLRVQIREFQNTPQIENFSFLS